MFLLICAFCIAVGSLANRHRRVPANSPAFATPRPPTAKASPVRKSLPVGKRPSNAAGTAPIVAPSAPSPSVLTSNSDAVGLTISF